MQGVCIRPATAQDAPAVACIHWDSWIATYGSIFPQAMFNEFPLTQREEIWSREAVRHGDPTLRRQLLVAAAGERLAGFASVGPYRPQESDDPAAALGGELFAIYLDPALQRNGIGRALWQASSAWLQTAGFDALRLWCIAGNEAEAFYRAMGAQCVAHGNFDAHGRQLGENCYRAATRQVS